MRIKNIYVTYINSNDLSSGVAVYDEKGQEKWHLNIGAGFMEPLATVSPDGTSYFVKMEPKKNSLYSISKTGQINWHSPLPGYSIGLFDHLVSGRDGTIFLSTLQGDLVAMNPNGTKKWTFHSPTLFLGEPAVSKNGTIYVASSDVLYALNPDGSKKWTYPINGRSATNLIVDDNGSVYVPTNSPTSEENAIYAINADGNLKWKLALQNYPRSARLSKNGLIYLLDNRSVLHALTLDGIKKWDEKVENTFDNLEIGADETIYLTYQDKGYLTAVKP